MGKHIYSRNERTRRPSLHAEGSQEKGQRAVAGQRRSAKKARSIPKQVERSHVEVEYDDYEVGRVELDDLPPDKPAGTPRSKKARRSAGTPSGQDDQSITLPDWVSGETAKRLLTDRPRTERRWKRRKRAPIARPGRGRFAGAHLLLALSGAIVVGLLLLLVFAILPSPIDKLQPAENGWSNSRKTAIKVVFGKEAPREKISLEVDGKNVMEGARVSGKTLSAEVELKDGKHTAFVTIDNGGLGGKHSRKWSFTVDTKAPVLTISERTVTRIEGTDKVRVSFSGKVDKDVELKIGDKDIKVDDNRSFTGETTASTASSLELIAKDKAGNRAQAFFVTQKPVAAKGAHVSVYVAGSESGMKRMIDLVTETELNTLQIDIKDEAGQIGFELDNELAKAIGSGKNYIRNMDGLVDTLRYHDVYSIARIVCFRDPILASAKKELAVQDGSGGLWNRGGWLDPYSKEVWDYTLATAEAAAMAGVNEIQFDYVRFPSDGDTTTCVFPSKDEREPSKVIDAFLAYAQERLSKYNVFISADVFGLTASSQGSMGIGQDVKELSKRVDYLSPMMYPSHYAPGEYNIKSPEANPGDIVTASIKEFQVAMKGTSAILRPWLQDFSLRIPYTADMVRRQIDACEKLGVDEWILWDPDCNYTKDALKPAK